MDPTGSADGDPLTLGWNTPDNDEEFIASLLPHSLSRQTLQSPSIGSSICTNPHLRSEEDRSLFNHYIHVVSRALSRSHDSDQNPFLVTLLPLAATSDTVTSVILSLSGCHWKRVYPSIWKCALRRQGQGTPLVFHEFVLRLIPYITYSIVPSQQSSWSVRWSMYLRSMCYRTATLSDRIV